MKRSWPSSQQGLSCSVPNYFTSVGKIAAGSAPGSWLAQLPNFCNHNPHFHLLPGEAGQNLNVFVVSECVWPTAVWRRDTDRCGDATGPITLCNLSACSVAVPPLLGEGGPCVTEAEVTFDCCENVQTFPWTPTLVWTLRLYSKQAFSLIALIIKYLIFILWQYNVLISLRQ